VTLSQNPGDAADVTISSLLAAERTREAAELVISEYGPSLLRFLRVRLRSYEQADDAFSLLCEDIWLGLPRFEWRSSLRTWLFVLARSAAARVVRSLRRMDVVSADTDQSFLNCCERVRTTTTIYRQTDTKRRVRALREQLDEDQQTLLILRVDQGLSWLELAIILDEVEAGASELEQQRATARMRTRYQVAKKRLRVLVHDAGLMPAVDD